MLEMLEDKKYAENLTKNLSSRNRNNEKVK